MSFLPTSVADAWRLLLWAGILIVLIRMGVRAYRGEDTHVSLVYGRGALFVLLFAQGVLQAERWGQGLTWEGAPPATAALILAWLAMGNDRNGRAP